MKVAVISTSPRKHSNSLKVAKYLRSTLAEQGVEDIDLFDFDKVDIPMVGRGSLQKNKMTPFQRQLYDVWNAADLVIFTLPEYNWSTSGEFINTLHQLGDKGFDHLFDGKVFALVGVSTGRGGRQPCLEITTMLNKLISFLHQYSVVSPKIFESHETNKNLDEAGHSTGNTIYEKGIKDFVKYSLQIARKWHGVAVEA